MTASDTYCVEENDTLASIAIRFDITLLSLKQENSLSTLTLFPGQRLRIPKTNEVIQQLDPIDSQLFNRSVPVNGLLMLMDEAIRFDPQNHRIKPMWFPLSNLILPSITIAPHPCEMVQPDTPLPPDSLALITLVLLDTTKKPAVQNTSVFTGKHEELLTFRTQIELRAKPIQAKLPPPALPEPEPVVKKKTSVNPAFPDGVSTILTAMQSVDLRAVFPRHYRMKDWNLVFRASRDGYSYIAILGQAIVDVPMVLVIKTREGDCIGAFADNGFGVDKGKVMNSEAFVFTFTPKFASYRLIRRGSFVLVVDQDEISISGDGAAAIWIDQQMLNGFSEKCEVFGSPPLASKAQFQVGDLELWRIR